MILDIHTHHPAPQSEAVISMTPSQFADYLAAIPNLQSPSGILNLQSPSGSPNRFSLGFHPWEALPSPDDWRVLEELAKRPEVVAIGECGFDKAHDAARTIHEGKPSVPFAFKMLAFRRHFELSERLHKPMILHCVKADDIILVLKRELQPTQPWVIHGFRGKPQAAEQLMRAGILLSFGEKFNEETLRLVGPDRLISETDESPLSIEEIIGLQSAALQVDFEELKAKIAANISAVIKI